MSSPPASDHIQEATAHHPDRGKYKIEHSPTSLASCQKKACKDAGEKIQKGELRFGTYTSFMGEDMIWTWKHWACITPAAIRKWKAAVSSDVEATLGFRHLTPEAQTVVREAFEAEYITDTTFKGTRAMEDAKVENSPNRHAGCQNAECKVQGVKIEKGELRFGSLEFDFGHTTWKYKHWGCVSDEEIQTVMRLIDNHVDHFKGLDAIDTESQAIVRKDLEAGHVIDKTWKGPPAMLEELAAPPRKKRKSTGDEGADDALASSKLKVRARKKSAPDASLEAEKGSTLTKTEPLAKTEPDSETQKI